MMLFLPQFRKEGVYKSRGYSVCFENEFTSTEVDKISELFKDSVKHWDVLGFCLTPNKDMLSQWRGYADDGCGFAIGFNEENLRKVRGEDGELVEVVYEIDEQLRIVRDRIQPSLETIRSGLRTPKPDLAGKTPKERLRAGFFGPKFRMRATILSLNDTMYRLKNSAFHEEKETRLIKRVTHEYHDCDFHRSGRKLVPHCSLEFSRVEPAISIERVVLGPSNPTPPNIVEAFLRENGFEDAVIDLSNATYRSSK